jgi:hypothetical protein
VEREPSLREELPNGQIRIRRAEFERWLDSLEEVA